jgi:hypothetical protein
MGSSRSGRAEVVSGREQATTGKGQADRRVPDVIWVRQRRLANGALFTLAT